MRVTASIHARLLLAMRPKEREECSAYIERLNAMLNTPLAIEERERMTRDLVTHGRTYIDAPSRHIPIEDVEAPAPA